MSPKYSLAGAVGNETGAMVACFLILIGPGGYAATSTPADANTCASCTPQWNLGDYWIMQDVEMNRLSPKAELMPPRQWLYCVVARTNLGGVACHIVEKWPNPVHPAFPQQHSVYYFRAADLGVVRRVDWFYLQGALCGPATTDYAPQAETPHVAADGLWFPSFSLKQRLGVAAQSLPDACGQIVSQAQALIEGNRLTGPPLTTATPNAALWVAASSQTGIVVTLSEGLELGATARHQQAWLPGLPWFLHEERVANDVLVGESWLVEHGQARLGETIQPSDALDLSPIDERKTSSLNAAVQANVTQTEQFTAPTQPWAGCWWPFYDVPGNANLYDVGSGNADYAMFTYDNYFTPGQTPAWSWEYGNHRTTDPAQWWWGHCDGWASSSIMEPRKPMTSAGPFSANEQQGLLAECWNTFDKAYYSPASANISDTIPMTPGSFWQALRDNIRGDATGGISRPVGFDLYSCSASTSGRDQVWNYPVFAYSASYSTTDGHNYTGSITIRVAEDEPNPISAEYASFSVTYTFRNVVINAGVLVPNSGVWTSSTWRDDPNDTGVTAYVYPDVAWYPTTPVGENPHINYQNVRGMSRVAAPGNLSASLVSGRVNLSWVDHSSNETGFRIESRADSSGLWTQISSVGSNIHACTLAPSSGSHVYRVRAYNSTDGNSLYSNEASAGSATNPVVTTALSVGAPPLPGAIAPAGDVNWYVFTVARAGPYSITTVAGTLAHTMVALYGPKTQTSLVESYEDRIIRTLTSGTYYIKITAFTPSATGAYTIRISKESTPIALKLNAAFIKGLISPAGDADWYTFSVSTTEQYTIATASGTLADNYMYLFGPDNQSALLQENDDNGTSTAAQIVRILAPGKYYVKIRAYDAKATGSYNIRVFTEPMPITLHISTELTSAISPVGDYDWYAFTVTTTGTYTITTTSGTLADTYMSLYGPNSRGTLLQEDDDSGVGLASQIVRRLTPGTYYVKVRAYSFTDTGTYKIIIIQ